MKNKGPVEQSSGERQAETEIHPGTRKIRIFLAEDQTIFREVLRHLLSTDARLEVVGEAEDGFKAVRGAAKLKPDMILMDLSMPRLNGIEALKEIKRSSKTIQILVLTSHEDEEHVLRAFEAGVSAYVVKDVAFHELLFAIGEVAKGKIYIGPAVCGAIVRDYLKNRPLSSPVKGLPCMMP